MVEIIPSSWLSLGNEPAQRGRGLLTARLTLLVLVHADQRCRQSEVELPVVESSGHGGSVRQGGQYAGEHQAGSGGQEWEGGVGARAVGGVGRSGRALHSRGCGVGEAAVDAVVPVGQVPVKLGGPVR